MSASAILGETPFAVVDLETTGVYPGGHDRIVEIAIVRMTPRFEIEEEWVTLVNPQRDIGRTDIHGIAAGDVTKAPLFGEVVGDIASRLTETIVVGHHLRFDLGFLSAEFARNGIALPTLPGLCTLRLAYTLLDDPPSRKLGYCCEEAGILHDDEHTALGDARATGYLLVEYIARARRRGAVSLSDLGLEQPEFPDSRWPASLVPSGRTFCRSAAAARNRGERAYLARLVEAMLGDEARTANVAEYLSSLDRVLEDRRVTQAEAETLLSAATSLRLTRASVLDAHRAYLGNLVAEALSDGKVSAEERRDLEEVCDMLGLHRAALEVLLATPERSRSISPPETGPADLRGKSVCFTGELLSFYREERVTRDIAERLAAHAGLDVRPGVTKALDILVVADPDTQSVKARKARAYGVRIMAERVFWQTIGVSVA
jgi:DNA polymerase-3 subunit epsilon